MKAKRKFNKASIKTILIIKNKIYLNTIKAIFIKQYLHYLID